MCRCAVLVALLLLSGCSNFPERAYFPPPNDPETKALAAALYRAANAASDDPARYSFAMIQSLSVSAYTADDATFYFSQGLARQPARVIDGLIAHEVAHELLGHSGQRRNLSVGLSAGFTVLGVLIPGAGLVDLVANPLIVRAYTRDQETAADLKAVEVLRSMGYDAPRRLLADALNAASRVNGTPKGGWLATEPDLAARLSALEPLEGATDTAASAAARQR